MIQNETMVKKTLTTESEDKQLNSDVILNYDGEDTVLKQELRIAAGHCQMLAEKLCWNDLPPAIQFGDVLLNTPESSEGQCCREQREKTTAVVAQNIKLRQELKNVTEANKRWQKFNADQQMYIQRLHRNIETLKTGVEIPAMEVSHVPFRQEESRVPMTEAAKTLLFYKRNYENVQKEMSRLEDLVVQLRAELNKTGHELEMAKKTGHELEIAKKTIESSSAREICDAQEKIELLSLQAKLYKEDWGCEKEENKKVKRRLVSAEASVQDLTSKCESLVLRLRQIQAATLDVEQDNSKINTSVLFKEDAERFFKESGTSARTLYNVPNDELFDVRLRSSKLAPQDTKDNSNIYGLEEQEVDLKRPETFTASTKCNQNLSRTNFFINGMQLRVIPRGSSRHSQANSSKKHIVRGEVEVDCASANSLPLERTLSASDNHSFDATNQLNFIRKDEESTSDPVSIETRKEHNSSDQHVQFSRSF